MVERGSGAASWRRVLGTWIGIGAAAAAVNATVVSAAAAAGVPTIPQLALPGIVGASVVGALAATTGWELVRRRAAAPVTTLRRLVPGVLLVSLVPDVLLGVVTAPGWAPIAVLASLHVTTAAIAVLVASRTLPVGPTGIRTLPTRRSTPRSSAFAAEGAQD